jgi:hypothetical protein
MSRIKKGIAHYLMSRKNSRTLLTRLRKMRRKTKLLLRKSSMQLLNRYINRELMSNRPRLLSTKHELIPLLSIGFTLKLKGLKRISNNLN